MTLILSGTDSSVSAPAVQGGTGGTTTGLYYPATNQLALATNGTQALLVDSSQNVGIGVTPSSWATSYKAIQIGNVGRSFAQTGAGAGDLTSVFNAYYDATNSRWQFGYTGDYAARYSITGAGNHVWYTSSGTGTANGAVTFNTMLTMNSSGNLTFGQSNAGIVFNNSSSLNNQTLNDYEYGTWTPTDAVPGSVGLNNNSGYYVKIGKMVYASARFFYNVNSNGTGVQIGGLPFVTSGGGFAVGYTGYTTNGTAVNFRTANSNAFYVSNAATGANITAATLSNQEIQMTFMYASF
jgi:hypothetical protein